MEFKNENIMDYTYFDDVDDLVSCTLYDIFESGRSVVVFCKSNLATNIIKGLSKINDVVLNRVDIDLEDEDDYAIFLSNNFVMDCVKASGYFKNFTDETIYVHGDCSDEIVKDVIGGNWTEFEFKYEVDANDIPIDNDFLELNFTCDCCGLYVCISPIMEDEECELWTTEMYLEDECGTRTEIVERQNFEEVKAIRDEWIENFR